MKARVAFGLPASTAHARILASCRASRRLRRKPRRAPDFVAKCATRLQNFERQRLPVAILSFAPLLTRRSSSRTRTSTTTHLLSSYSIAFLAASVSRSLQSRSNRRATARPPLGSPIVLSPMRGLGFTALMLACDWSHCAQTSAFYVGAHDRPWSHSTMPLRGPRCPSPRRGRRPPLDGAHSLLRRLAGERLEPRRRTHLDSSVLSAQLDGRGPRARRCMAVTVAVGAGQAAPTSAGPPGLAHEPADRDR